MPVECIRELCLLYLSECLHIESFPNFILKVHIYLFSKVLRLAISTYDGSNYKEKIRKGTHDLDTTQRDSASKR
jgi:hypothetical protein